MAQAPRSAGSSAGSSASFSDDPIESFTTWLQVNSKPIAMVVGGAAIAAAAIFVYRSTTAATREKASAALYTAQQPFIEGKYAEAETALTKVVDRFGGTASGQQAVLMLAQVDYEQKKYDDGIKALEKAVGSASADFKPSMYSTIAAGYEFKADFAKAAEAYGKAAGASPFPSEKESYQVAQARSLMAAGKGAEAKTIWESLSQLEGSPVQQEAQVRLGELAGKQP